MDPNAFAPTNPADLDEWKERLLGKKYVENDEMHVEGQVSGKRWNAIIHFITTTTFTDISTLTITTRKPCPSSWSPCYPWLCPQPSQCDLGWCRYCNKCILCLNNYKGVFTYWYAVAVLLVLGQCPLDPHRYLDDVPHRMAAVVPLALKMDYRCQ